MSQGASNDTGDILDASNGASVCRCYVQKGRLASVCRCYIQKGRFASVCRCYVQKGRLASACRCYLQKGRSASECLYYTQKGRLASVCGCYIQKRRLASVCQNFRIVLMCSSYGCLQSFISSEISFFNFQILNDVLAEIEPTTNRNRMDIRSEPIEDTVVRILNMLRVLKYKPPNDDP